MALHGYCEWNCGGTDCDAPYRVTSTETRKPRMVAIVEGDTVRWMTVKDAAIEEIKAQPFYAPNVKVTG